MKLYNITVGIGEKKNHLSKANIGFTRLVVSFELLLLTLNMLKLKFM